MASKPILKELKDLQKDPPTSCSAEICSFLLTQTRKSVQSCSQTWLQLTRIGLDVLAIAKREGSKVDGGFKTPRERVVSVVSSIEEEEQSESVNTDEKGSDASPAIQSHSRRRYREISGSETPRTARTFKLEDGFTNS